jgi:hypothetical protein
VELLRDCPFTFDGEKKIGHMRCDYDGGRDIRPFTQWNPTKDVGIVCEEYDINIHDLDSVVNRVIDELDSYSKFMEYIPDSVSDYDSVNYFFQYNGIDVWVRMMPARNDYNMYINLYHQ